MPILYRTKASATGGRAGHGATEDGTVDVTLTVPKELDPDGLVRQSARRALAGATVPFSDPPVHEVTWLRMTLDGGQPPPPGEAFVGSLVRSDGLAVPVVFDDEGFALVVGLPPGEGRLVLAPKLPPYKEGKKP